MSDSHTHFIIRLQVAKKGSPIKQGEKGHEFFRNEHYDAHIYQDKVFPLDQLNELYPKVLQQYWDFEMPAPAPMPPIPVLVKPPMCPNMAKARAAIGKYDKEKDKGATSRSQKRLFKKGVD